MPISYPEYSATIRNYYWLLRYYGRDTARRRKLYRQIAAEKKRLHEAGVDFEELRLLCRHLANPRNRAAADRLRAYTSQLKLALAA